MKKFLVPLIIFWSVTVSGQNLNQNRDYSALPRQSILFYEGQVVHPLASLYNLSGRVVMHRAFFTKRFILN